MQTAKILVLTYYTLLIKVQCRYVPENVTDTLNHTQEVQHAVCKVATAEIQVSANASITRQLKGVCSSKALNSKFREMEKLLVREMETIKLMLQSAGYTTPKPSKNNDAIIEASDDHEDYDYLNEVENYRQAKFTKSLEYTMKNSTGKSDASGHGNDGHSEPLANVQSAPRKKTIREDDVLICNETIQDTDMGRAFVYYWKISDIKNILMQDVYLTSPSIDFLGQMLHVKFSPRHLGTKYTNIELISSGFFYKIYRFVLMHTDEKQDLNSQLLGNVKKYATRFRIATDKIEAFIEDDALLLKLLIYMDL